MDRLSEIISLKFNYEVSEITDEKVGILSNYLFRNINHRISAVNHI